jgi:UDP-N-acetylmuramate--alanine ligase
MAQLPFPSGATIHLVGIAGSGMSSLAVLLQHAGYVVTGSDVAESDVSRSLRETGIPVASLHEARNVGSAALVIRSSAVPEANPEIVEARRRGLDVLKHSEAIGQISAASQTLAVAGTHGKTTTTAMLAEILLEGGLDPTALVGGIVPRLGSGAHLGAGDSFVVEADEFDRRFLELRPRVAVVTNVEPDHLDYYGTFDAIRDAFAAFVELVPTDGWVVLNADNPGSRNLAERAGERAVTYGLDDAAEWRAAGVTVNEIGGSDFVVYAHDLLVGQFRLQVPGRHNVSNALAAAVAAGRVGVDFTTAAAALARFGGVRRRLETIGRAGGVTIVDDYAHHPTKIRASLAGAREQHAGRIVVLFQPHQYQRLNSLFGDFVESFADADLVIVSDVYAPAGRGAAAGERTARDLALAIPGRLARYGGRLEQASELTASLLRPGDMLITMGAGDVTTAGPGLLRLLESRVGPS